RVLQRSASHEAARLKLFDFMIKTERSRRRDEIGVICSGKLDFETLLSDQRMRKVDVVLNRERVRRIDAERLAAVLQNEFFSDPDELPRLLLLHYASAGNRFSIRKRAAVQNRNLEVVELDIRIVD